MSEAVAEDLSIGDRAALKHLAQQLAGAVVSDLGLDPTSSIFTMGKTSALVGHTLQPLLPDLLQEREEEQVEEEGEATPCRPASLLLIDRSCDLFSPAQHDGTGPLAHRILSLLPRQRYPPSHAAPTTQGGGRGGVDGEGHNSLPGMGLTDVMLLQEASGEGVSSRRIGGVELLVPAAIAPGQLARWGGGDAASALLSPLSALSLLPFPLLPSIVPPYADSTSARSARNSLFLHAMFAQSEERGREALGGALKKLLPPEEKEEEDERGTSPSTKKKKKKGLGAEMLGLVQTVTSTSCTSQQEQQQQEDGSSWGEGYSPGVVQEHAGLLCWALAVVEAMQRSSSKQLTSHLRAAVAATSTNATATTTTSTVVVGRASFELRSQRENEVLLRLVQASLAPSEGGTAGGEEGGKGGGGITASRVVQILLDTCALQPPRGTPPVSVAMEEEVVIVKDLKHSLLLSMR